QAAIPEPPPSARRISQIAAQGKKDAHQAARAGFSPARGGAAPRKLFEVDIVKRAIVESFIKLDPRHQVKNPVMFVVEVGSALTTLLFIQALIGKGEAPAGFIAAVSAWLWFTVLF